MKHAVRVCLLFLSFLLPGANPASAAFPDRPVTIVVGFAAGGAGDIIARSVGLELEKELGQPVVIVNKGGSGGALAIGDALTRPADGYTIVGTISAALTLDTLTAKTRYSLADFSLLGMTGVYQEGFFCLADKPWKSMKELVAWAKRENRALSYPSSVVFDKLITRYIGEKEGIEIRAVPVQGGAAIISSVLGGHTEFGYGGGFQSSYVKAGKMRHLAGIGSQRSPYAPDVPTLAEEGWPLLVFDNYFAFYASKKVPAEILTRLSEALVRAGSQPSVQQALAGKAGVYPAVFNAAESTKILEESLVRYRNMLEEMKK